MGMPDPDNMFKFCTPKYVYIRDWKLGLAKYVLMGLIFFYVVMYKIVYSCTHLSPYHAHGFGTISMSHPIDNCDQFNAKCQADFSNIATLPYCEQFNPDEAGEDASLLRQLQEEETAKASDKEEKSADKEEDGKTEKAPKETLAKEKELEEGIKDKCPNCGKIITPKRRCRYLDNRRLTLGEVPSEIFIPTMYQHITQQINPDCYNPATSHETSGEASEAEMKKKYRCKSPYKTIKTEEFYIADIERYTLQMSHTFNAPLIGMSGVSTDFQGLFAACPNDHPSDIASECKRAKVKGSTGAIAPEDDDNLISVEDLKIPSLETTATGEDRISFGDLLKVTPVANRYEKVRENVLDSAMPKNFGHEGKSLRESGGMLMLDVDYSNNGFARPGIPGLPDVMQIKPITYSYRPSFVPTNEVKKHQLIQKSDHGGQRVIDVWYGTTIKMQFNGELVLFAWAKLFKALTAGLLLLTMASTLVTYWASFCMPMQEKYNALMYQVSEDMSEHKKMRKARVSCLAGIINPLGLLEGPAWSKMESVFVTGTMLWKYLQEDGTPNPAKQLPDSEIIKILCMNELRLNRLDAMDTRVSFDGSDPVWEQEHRIGKLTKSMKKTFYDAAAGAAPGAPGL